MQTDPSLLRDSVLAQPISHLFLIVGIVMAAILLLVTVLVLYVSFRYRSHVANVVPQQEFGRTSLEILWTVGPVLILVFIFAATIHAMKESSPPAPSEFDEHLKYALQPALSLARACIRSVFPWPLVPLCLSIL